MKPPGQNPKPSFRARLPAFGVVLFLAAPILLFAAADQRANGNWPGWRGDGSGIASEDARVPLELNDTTRLWKVEIEGLGHSSPIVWGNRIFLTTAIEGEQIEGAEPPVHTWAGQEFRHPQSVGGDRHHTLKVIAVDTEDGSIVWSQVAFAGQVYDDRHRGSSYASPTAVTDGKRAYAYFGSEGVYAYDFEGELVWKRDIGKIKTVGLGVGSSPVLVDDRLIIQADEDSGDDSFIVALDTATGRELWRTPRTVQASWSTPLVIVRGGKKHVVTSGNELVISYDAATGKEIWRASGLGNNAIHHPMFHQDLLIFSSGYPEKAIFALSADLEGDVSAQDKAVWRYSKGTAYVPSNLLYGDHLYLMNDGGVITCLDAATGHVVYEGGRFPIRSRFTASPVGVDGKVLMINESGDAAFFRAGPKFEILAQSSIGEPVSATPAIVDDRIYVRGRQHLHAFGAKAE